MQLQAADSLVVDADKVASSLLVPEGRDPISAATLELEEPVGRRPDTENGRRFESAILEVVEEHEVGALEEEVEVVEDLVPVGEVGG